MLVSKICTFDLEVRYFKFFLESVITDIFTFFLYLIKKEIKLSKKKYPPAQLFLEKFITKAIFNIFI